MNNEIKIYLIFLLYEPILWFSFIFMLHDLQLIQIFSYLITNDFD